MYVSSKPWNCTYTEQFCSVSVLHIVTKARFLFSHLFSVAYSFCWHCGTLLYTYCQKICSLLNNKSFKVFLYGGFLCPFVAAGMRKGTKNSLRPDCTHAGFFSLFGIVSLVCSAVGHGPQYLNLDSYTIGRVLVLKRGPWLVFGLVELDQL